MSKSRRQTTRTETVPAIVDESQDASVLRITAVFTPNPADRYRSAVIGERLVIGRDPVMGATFVLDDPNLSRCHATLTREAAFYAVRDAHSSNGTFVDARRIDHDYVGEGSVIRVGSSLLVIHRGPRNLADLPPEDPEIIGRSEAIREVVHQLAQAGPTDQPVLILGESGVGKELAAQRIHKTSGRAGDLIAVNCANLQRDLAESWLFGHTKGSFTGAHEKRTGYFAAAEDGTLFLDEIGTLPIEIQPKLLRVLENREFYVVGTTRSLTTNVRIVTATNDDLEAKIERGEFRRDLLARIDVFAVRIPPLRQRREDILMLAEHFLQTALPGHRFVMGLRFAEALVTSRWIDNIRGLRKTMNVVAVMNQDPDILDLRHCPDALREEYVERADGPATAPPQPMMPTPAAPVSPRSASPSAIPVVTSRRPSMEELVAVLDAAEGNLSKVALRYRKDRQQIYRWLRHYQIDLTRYRQRPEDE